MLISAAQLKALLAHEAVVVFDCRFSLQDPAKGRQQYVEGHIPGAVYLSLNDDLSSPVQVHGGRHPLPSQADFTHKLAVAGVNDNSRIVVYDNGEGMATRAWWLLRYFGHEEVAVLDGGWKAWLASNMPVNRDVPAPKSGHFTPRPRADRVVSVQEVERLVAEPGETALLDARAADRYRGENETIDPLAGHIPGAYNAPWLEGIDAEGAWKPADAQRKRFARFSNQPVVVYCGSGVTACATLFAMELAGLRDVKLYPGSWSDWCSYAEHPIATGEEK